jgi:hypothetical protein
MVLFQILGLYFRVCCWRCSKPKTKHTHPAISHFGGPER